MAKPLPTPVRNHLAGLRILLLFTLLCGLAYPLVVTGISHVAFSRQAGGSLVRVDGRVVGSSLIGQDFTIKGPNGKTVRPDPKLFQSRPSAAGAQGYDALASGATNLGPNSVVLAGDYTRLRQEIASFNGVRPSQVPPDAITASGSGLDPDISPQYASLQVDRVAKARGVSPAAVRALVRQYTQGRTAGFLGEPRVNVLDLNIALTRVG